MIKACDQALEDKQAQLVIRDQEIGQGQSMLETQAKEIIELDNQAHAWYRSPFLWVILGLGAGIYIGKK